MRKASRFASIFATCVFACAPDLGDRDSLVTGPRVLAVRAEPPEAAPGDDVTYTALVVAPDGTRASAPVAWSFCVAPKTLTENEIVSAACLGDDAIRAAGDPGSPTHATIPSDACALFGPDPPPGGYRARDPDVTGGYYQPLRALLDGTHPSFVLERLACHLANAPADIATDYGLRYRRNANPHLSPLVTTIGGVPAAGDHVPTGARVTLSVGWNDADAESYVTFDLASQSLIDRREAMRVSWFATAGDFGVDRTGRAEDDRATTTENTWTAPSSTGKVHLWIVVRDSRGGIDFAPYDVDVVP